LGARYYSLLTSYKAPDAQPGWYFKGKNYGR
jgi:hypothetical protein